MAEAQKINFEHLKGFSDEQRAAIVSTIAEAMSQQRTPKELEQDALGNRDLVGQATASRSSAPKPASVAVRKPGMFKQAGDESSRNAIRLALGTDDPFGPVVQFGNNTYIPDAHVLYRLLDAVDLNIMNVKRFYDSAAGWHPLISRFYVAVLLHIHIFRVMKEVGELSGRALIFYNDFITNYPLETLPLPGPLVNAFNSLAASAPAFQDYDNVFPVLPRNCTASRRNNLVLAEGWFVRLPPPLVLLDQYVSMITNVTSADGIVEYPRFLRNVAGNQMTPDPPANADPYHRRTISETDATRAHTVISPGLDTPVGVTHDIATRIWANRIRIRSEFPRVLTANTAAGSVSWTEYMGLETTRHQVAFKRAREWMTIYSKFTNSSCSLADIPPVGHTAGQYRFEFQGTPIPLPDRLFPEVVYSYVGQLRNLSSPPADGRDAAVSCLNTTSSVASHNVPTAQGPYFNNLPILKATGVITPENGFGVVVREKYIRATEA